MSLTHCLIFYGSFYYFESSLLNILRAMILKFVLWSCRNGGCGYDRTHIPRSEIWNMRNQSLFGDLNRCIMIWLVTYQTTYLQQKRWNQGFGILETPETASSSFVWGNCQHVTKRSLSRMFDGETRERAASSTFISSRLQRTTSESL